MNTKYEITYFTAKDDETDTAERAIKELGGKVIEVNNLGERQLAYPVNKLTEGNFVSVIFNLPAENLEELDKKIKQERKIIRHILIKALRVEKEMPKQKMPEKPAEEVKSKPKTLEPDEPQAKPAKPKIVKKPAKTKDEGILSSKMLDEKLKELTED